MGLHLTLRSISPHTQECDVALVVLDVPRLAPSAALSPAALSEALRWERQIVESALKHEVTPMLLFNVKGSSNSTGAGGINGVIDAVQRVLDPKQELPSLNLNLNAGGGLDVSGAVSTFLQDGVKRSRARPQVKSLPEWALREDAMVFLNIPMDAETPSMRLLRPQALVQVGLGKEIDIV